MLPLWCTTFTAFFLFISSPVEYTGMFDVCDLTDVWRVTPRNYETSGIWGIFLQTNYVYLYRVVVAGYDIQEWLS